MLPSWCFIAACVGLGKSSNHTAGVCTLCAPAEMLLLTAALSLLVF